MGFAPKSREHERYFFLSNPRTPISNAHIELVDFYFYLGSGRGVLYGIFDQIFQQSE